MTADVFTSDHFSAFTHKTKLINKEQALKGRNKRIFEINDTHHALKGHRTIEPFPKNMELAIFGMGCFWGAERMFWNISGVYSTNVGYAGGYTPNPTYDEVCSGKTGHAEVIRVIFDPSKVTYAELLKNFWQSHDPTQGMRQGNDIGTQYRSCIYYYNEEQMSLALQSKDDYEKEIKKSLNHYIPISTEIKSMSDLEFYYAEDYHQQYLSKEPDGYCNLKGIGVSCPLPKINSEKDTQTQTPTPTPTPTQSNSDKSNKSDKPENKDES